MPPRAVSAADLEMLLEKLRHSTPEPRLGVYGPASINWKVNCEAALFLAAGRAALLQLAHPWVAAAIAQHSRTLDDPVGRFHQTFRVMFTMSFGTLDEAFTAARRLHRMHESIHGVLPESMGRFAAGSHYQANDVDALAWVFATLLESSLLAYDLALPPLSSAEREGYYREYRASAALFGVPPDQFPPDLSGFECYMQDAMRSDMLGVSASTRRLAHHLHAGKGLLVPLPAWYRALTTHLLPPHFREEFQFEYSSREQQSAERALHWIREIYPRLPAPVRYVGPYLEAEARLDGRRAAAAVRLSNRLWIGLPTLFSRGLEASARESKLRASTQAQRTHGDQESTTPDRILNV
jgi:uncharacterized protein (DUF2236 family)